MDMEYYHGTFQEHEKILKGLSAYLKGKISLYQFLILYRKSLLDMLPKGIPLDQIIWGEVDVEKIEYNSKGLTSEERLSIMEEEYHIPSQIHARRFKITTPCTWLFSG